MPGKSKPPKRGKPVMAGMPPMGDHMPRPLTPPAKKKGKGKSAPKKPAGSY